MQNNRSIENLEEGISKLCQILEKDKDTLLGKSYNLKMLGQKKEIALKVLEILKKDFLKIYADAREEK